MAKFAAPEELVRQYDEQAKRVLEDVTLKREYQVQALEEIYNETRQAIQQQIEEEREEKANALRLARRICFEAPTESPRDKALATLMLDQHLEKLWPMDSVQEVEQYLNRQLLIDSPVGVKAVLIKAVELQSSQMVGRILMEYPEWEEAYENFVEAIEDLNSFNRSPGAMFGAGRLRSPQEYLA